MRDMSICPVCGEECNEYYVSDYGQKIVGCEHCIHTESAYERDQKDREEALQDIAYERRMEIIYDKKRT